MARRSRPVDIIHEFLRAIWKLDHDLQRVSKRMEATVGLTGPQRLCLLHIGRQPRITRAGSRACCIWTAAPSAASSRVSNAAVSSPACPTRMIAAAST